VEYATSEWVGGFNNWRSLELKGIIPPAEFKHAYYAEQEDYAAPPNQDNKHQQNKVSSSSLKPACQ
jgi:hypothetical protein